MKSSIRDRLRQVSARYEEVGLLLSQPDVFSDQNRYRALSVEYAQLEPLAKRIEYLLGIIGRSVVDHDHLGGHGLTK